MTTLADASKDDLVLAMLAVLGGERVEVNERDLFLASWHAFPNTMRWVDTPLPNPDTFTAALRRLDQRGMIERVGKQQRKRSKRARRSPLDPTRSGVVKARVAPGGLEKAEIGSDLIEEVRKLLPDATKTKSLNDGALITICCVLRQQEHRPLDEGALVELAFHKFPDRFAYEHRREFPDVERVRTGVAHAQRDGLIGEGLEPTLDGQSLFEKWEGELEMRLDASQAHEAGDLLFAGRIEKSPAYQAYLEHGTLIRTKADELYRALRVPPTTDPRPVAEALSSRARALYRIDKGELAAYLFEVARKHNPDVASLVEPIEDAGKPARAEVTP